MRWKRWGSGSIKAKGLSFGTLSRRRGAAGFDRAHAIIDGPRMLILDEPTANIDPMGQQSVHELLVQLNQTMTILMVTQDLQTIVDKR